MTLSPRKAHAKRRRNFFTELLPEGDQLVFMLADAGLRRGDTVGFLARYGIEGGHPSTHIVKPRLEQFPTVIFDRDPVGRRIHQEGFSQALGASGVQKYQSHGGLVALTRIAETLRTVGAHDDLPRLARLVILASALGNLDMHAKNLGILHPPDGSVRLAPGYDFVPKLTCPSIRAWPWPLQAGTPSGRWQARREKSEVP